MAAPDAVLLLRQGTGSGTVFDGAPSGTTIAQTDTSSVNGSGSRSNTLANALRLPPRVNMPINPAAAVASLAAVWFPPSLDPDVICSAVELTSSPCKQLNVRCKHFELLSLRPCGSAIPHQLLPFM